MRGLSSAGWAGFGRMRAGAVVLSVAPLLTVSVGSACECRWMGPFSVVARESPLVVRAVVRSHGGWSRVGPRHMDVDIVETLKGVADGPRLVVFGGDGMLCRPEVSRFPTGSEWVLALNGPGSKPGVEGGWALSMCGGFWLAIRGDDVQGNYDDDLDQHALQTIPLAGLRARLVADLAAPPRITEHFTGEVSAGERFTRGFDGRFTLHLEPVPYGWLLQVREAGREEDLSRLTPPLHFLPNPREIEGWHFRNADNSGPNEAGAKNVNAPGEVRRFVFSPEVGVLVDGPASVARLSAEDIDRVKRFGRGRLEILDQRLAGLEPGAKASIAWMRFAVDLSYPASAEPRPEAR